MGKEFFSGEDRGEFRVNVELPAGTSYDETLRVTRDIEQRIRQNKEVKTLFTVVGPGEEANKSSVRVYTSKYEQRPGVSVEAKVSWLARPKKRYSVDSDNPGTPGMGNDRPAIPWKAKLPWVPFNVLVSPNAELVSEPASLQA